VFYNSCLKTFGSHLVDDGHFVVLFMQLSFKFWSLANYTRHWALNSGTKGLVLTLVHTTIMLSLNVES